MTLPSSIETALLEAGLTATELLILNRLLEENAVTLRQLALKTGKSTGVLDQAMKKLMKKGMISKEEINGSPKYTLGSMQAIKAWMERDTRARQEQLKRRHENFESFISSVSVDRARPDLRHFHGEEGIKQAYIELLNEGKEMLVYMPLTQKEEDDPLREFRVQHFRMRRQKEMFSRVIAHDTPLGRRFVSRDPFEFRKTQLVDSASTPIPFEKIIVGDIVACFDHTTQSACFIQYPALADAERGIFESMWRGAMSKAGNPLPVAEDIPLKTRLLSQLRELYVSKSSVIALCIITLLSAAITFGAHQASLTSQKQKIRSTASSIAATGALQFDANELDKIRILKDIEKPEYSSIIQRMRAIRSQNKDVVWIYILRMRPDRELLEFVADGDSLNPSEVIDINHDGKIDESDEAIAPGTAIDAKLEDTDFAGMTSPTASHNPYTDQWGTFISGYAPIAGQNGEKYFFGVDVLADKIAESAIQLPALIFIFVVSFILLSLLYIFPFLWLWRSAGGSLRSIKSSSTSL